MKLSKEQISEKLNAKLSNSMLDLPESVCDLVIANYHEILREEIEKGNSIELPGIGTIIPSWRKVSDAFTDVPYTSKFKINMDKSLKSNLNEKLRTSPMYRSAVGADEL